MKILVVSQYYTPDVTAAAFRIAETVDHLKAMGNEVDVVTTFPHKSNTEMSVEPSMGGVHRVSLPQTDNKGFLGYIYLYLSFFVKSLIRGYLVARKKRPHIIWATSPPIFVGLTGWMLAKLVRAEFALDVRDIWPDSAVAAGQISDSGLAYSLGRYLEKFLYKKAEVISCVARPMKEYIQTYTNTGIEVVYNGVEIPRDNRTEAGTDADPHADILAPHACQKGVLKLLYAGNFGHVQQLELLIDAYAELKRDGLKNRWEIFFLGGGAREENLKELAERRQLTDCVHFLGSVSKDEVFGYLQSADALFIHLMDRDVFRLTIPSKVFDYMLVDRPLLTGIQGEGRKIIESVEGNIVFKSGDKSDLKRAFKELDLKIPTARPANALKIERVYSRKLQSEKLNLILKKACGQ